MEPKTTPPWAADGWQDQVSAWIRAALKGHGVSVRGAIEAHHVRPWSAVLRVPTTDGDVYFKATLPWLRHEVTVTEALARWRPDCMLPVLAADFERGWLLLPDGGARLREVVRETGSYRLWEPVLPVYSDVQVEMAGRVHELLGLGVPDRRLTALPAQYEQLLDDTETLRVGREPGITADEYRRLRALVPAFPSLCAELADYGVPETLNHGDLGDANVFMRDGRPVFFDWGDCVVSHPFYSLRTTFVSLYFSLQLDDGAPELDRLRDVYLAAWTRYAPPARLRAAFKLAQRLAAVNGALGWHSVVSRLTGAAREEYAHPVPALLQEFLALTAE